MCPIFEFSKYYVIFIYFQAAVSALLAVLCIEKKILHNILKIRKFDTYQLSNTFSCDRSRVCQTIEIKYKVDLVLLK